MIGIAFAFLRRVPWYVWVIVVLALAALWLNLSNARKTARIAELETLLAAQAAETREAVQANEAALGVVDGLTERLRDIVEERRVESERNARVIATRDNELAEARARARELEVERDTIWRSDPDCADLAGTRVDLMCPAIADRLRERSRGASGESPGGGGGPGRSLSAHAL